MKKALMHTLLVFACIIMVSSCNRARVIPKKTLAKVYAEMFMSDEWLKENYRLRRVADTTWVYEPIFRKYGYNRADYVKTADEYLKNPEEFAKILEMTVDILEADKADVEQRIRQEKYEKEFFQMLSLSHEDQDYTFVFDSMGTLNWAGPSLLQLDSLDTFLVDSADSLALDSLKVDFTDTHKINDKLKDEKIRIQIRPDK